MAHENLTPEQAKRYAERYSTHEGMDSIDGPELQALLREDREEKRKEKLKAAADRVMKKKK